MAEGPQSSVQVPGTTEQRGQHHPQRGNRGHRGGRSRRGGRGGPRAGSSTSDASSGVVNDSGLQSAVHGADQDRSQPAVGSQPSRPRDASRRGRGERRGRSNRRGAAGPSSMAPQRTFGGHLSAQNASSTAGRGLSASASEFVPGQPVMIQSTTPAPPREIRPRRMSKSVAPDLPTRIHEDIDNGQYECVICTNEVLRTSQIWSCSICWTVSHLHCVRKWHKNQLKDTNEPENPDQLKTWRCPGCNSTMGEDPGPHHCWCGKEINSKSIVGLPPHSCGQSCVKPRARCPHSCPLECHAGPCPPCTLMGPMQPCFCGKNTSTKRCSETDYVNGWSCEEVCDDLLPCGEHNCLRPCHSGLCGGCEVSVLSTCYCGRSSKEVPCAQREEVMRSFDHGQLVRANNNDLPDSSRDPWFDGSFHCSSPCGRSFDCGHHACEKKCHPQDEISAHCPLSPDVVTHCPCGKTSLSELLSAPRKSCVDRVPQCEQMCGKLLPCGHFCTDKCHFGTCGECRVKVDIPCRCGRTTTAAECHLLNEMERPDCGRSCRSQMNCGRHVCDKICCPGEKRATERLAAKRKKNANSSIIEDYEAEHICLRTCSRLLKCGTHSCQQLCHKGPCPSCPEAIFEEISCACGRTVLHPPQPCGTRAPNCRFDCTRPSACGHRSVSHQCHPDDIACPKCPFLVEKTCVCGKQSMKNKACGLEEVHCGLPCGKKLKCGTHQCQKTCHKPGECEDAGITGSRCSQSCSKSRISCGHPCTDQCHTPFACKEAKPCQSKVLETCDCQRRKQEVRCLATDANPSPQREFLKCDDECRRLQRNAKLAQALNVDPATHKDNHIPYSDDTMRFFRENQTWAQQQEREIRVFADDRGLKRHYFKPMINPQRAFLHSLAEDYGLDSQSLDPEPHRHVSLFKTPRFVSAPMKTLAQCLRIMKTTTATVANISTGTNSSLSSAPHRPSGLQPFNAFLLSAPRFGLTISEVDQALAEKLSLQDGLPLKFSTSFLPSDEVIIKAIPPTATAANIARAGSSTPAAVETTLSNLKPILLKTVKSQNLAGNVTLCNADGDLNILRREGDSAGGGGGGGSGWSAVAGRAAKPVGSHSGAVVERKAPSGFLALRRKKVEEPVDDDWEAAAAAAVQDEVSTTGTAAWGSGVRAA